MCLSNLAKTATLFTLGVRSLPMRTTRRAQTQAREPIEAHLLSPFFPLPLSGPYLSHNATLAASSQRASQTSSLSGGVVPNPKGAALSTPPRRCPDGAKKDAVRRRNTRAKDLMAASDVTRNS